LDIVALSFVLLTTLIDLQRAHLHLTKGYV
jgi:hypothetical protein